MVKIHIDFLKRILELKENELFRACDGQICYSVVRSGDHFILKEDDIEKMTQAIEDYAKNWEKHDAYEDFQKMQDFYNRLCALIGKDAKDLHAIWTKSSEGKQT